MLLLQKKLALYWGDVLALCSGALFPLAFAPFEWRLTLFVSLFLLLLTWQDVSAKRAFLRGWLWGLGAYLVGVSWVYNSMHDFGGAPPLAAAAFTLVFAAYLALYPALAGSVLVRFFSRSSGVFYAFAFGLIWALSEWLRSWVLTGFPWLMSGYALLDTPFAAYMPVFGSLGASVLMACTVACFGLCLLQTAKRLQVGILAVLLVVCGVSLNLVDWKADGAVKALDVALVQGNVPQELKLRSDSLNVSLQTYFELSQPHFGADLIVWPETAMPTYRYAIQGFLNKVAAEAEKVGSTVFTGIFFRAENGQDYYNAMLEVGGEWQSYKKHQLVPFGEYMPVRWALTLFSRFVDIPMSDMAVAPLTRSPLSLAGVNIANSICYEMAYPDVLRAQMNGAELMLNTSNDAWFGDSFAAHQHLEMARVRAKEFAKPIVRATNNGITAVLSYEGEVTAMIKQFQPGVLRHELALNSVKTAYAHVGQLLLACLIFLVLVLLVLFSTKGSTGSQVLESNKSNPHRGQLPR